MESEKMQKLNYRSWKIWLALILGVMGSQWGITASHANPNYTRFSQWCLAKESLPVETRHTVEELLRKVKTEDCNEAEQKLSGLSSLYLGNNQISDISPLQSLTHLTGLTLHSNDIQDISPIRSLTNLRELDLDQNQISDLIPLSELIELQKLYLRVNQISDLKPLSNLHRLKFLALSTNNINDLSSLAEMLNQYI